ncbi:MAG: SDR family NAD(P)-dependent oxidoreductase [Cyanophyceae cyanobacterium]
MHPIAIIGVGCRFPGASNPETFWQLLQSGTDAIREIPAQRWDVSSFYDPEPVQPGKMYTRWGGFLKQVDQFEPSFFGISPREAERMDPQQRLLLEVAWEALENAGLVPAELAGSRTGVFIGISNSDYSRRLYHGFPELSAYNSTGTGFCVAANRLSYVLDLKGPSLAIDTACSSSLVAVHLACQSLQSGESDLALVGGVNLILSPEGHITFSQARMMAADGRCKTFDARADGYVRGEGCGIVVLKRQTEAVANRNRIQAVIRGSAINQDGLTNGLTAPNGPSQRAVIRQALENAAVTPAQVSYIEAHGTGTALGDPIEFKSLKAVLMKERSSEQTCWLGSVKTNIGHLESAAGIAGLIKVVLAMQHREIPPHLHLKQLNPYISLEGTTFIIPTESQPWSTDKQIAGVSSFGFGGTNCHVIVEAAPIPPSKAEPGGGRPAHVLTLSAQSEPALLAYAHQYETFLRCHALSLADACFTTNTGRTHFPHRLAIVAQSTEQLLQQLSGVSAGKAIQGKELGSKQRRLACLFTGQGSQYENMGRRLYDTQPDFRAALECCAQILQPLLERPLLEVLYSEEVATTALLHETAYTQPALFAIEYALFTLWKTWGIRPKAVLGHSVGEYVAACVAGVFSLEDGLKLVAARAKLMQALPQDGEMLAVLASEEQVCRAIQGWEQVAIAAVNGPQSLVVSGERQAVRAVSAALKAEGIKTKALKVSHAFHSPLMEPMLAEFEQVAQAISYSLPKIPLISNVTGELATDEIATPQYWCQHIRQPVRFSDSLSLLHQQGYKIFLEIGPKPTLLGMGRSCLPAAEAAWLPSLRPGQSDWQQMLESLGELYVRGVPIDWFRFHQPSPQQRVALPTYPFQRQQYWFESDNPQLPQTSTQTSITALLNQGDSQQLTQQLAAGLSEAEKLLLPKLMERLVKQHQQQLAAATLDDWLYEVQWQPQPRPPEVSQNDLGHWLIFSDRDGLGQAVAKHLQEQGQCCFLVYIGDCYQQEADTWSLNPENAEHFERLWQEISPLPLQGVLHLWSLSAPSSELNRSSLEQAQIVSCRSVLYLVQSLSKQRHLGQPRLWLASRGVQPIGHQSLSLALAQASIWGLGKTIALEHPELWGGLIDLEAQATSSEAELMLAELGTPQGEQIAWRGGTRYVARLVANQLPQLPRGLSPERSYLITGGLGALGLKVAQGLVEQGARHIVLLGRREASVRAREIIASLEEGGVKIVVAQADVTLQQDLARVLAHIEATLPPLGGVIHAAGVLDDGILLEQNWERFQRVMLPKVQGAWNLHLLTQKQPLDFFVLFSSAASLLGSPGQGNYATANAFLDTLAHYRRRQGLPGLSINWGPWATVGMAASLDRQSQERMASRGVSTIPPDLGVQALVQMLGSPVAQVGILPFEWPAFARQLGNLQHPFLSELISTEPQAAPQPEPKFLQKLQEAPEQCYSLVATYLQEHVAQALGLNPANLDVEQSLSQVGLDSLMAVELRNQIKTDLEVELPISKLMEGLSATKLATYLTEQLNETLGAASPAPAIQPVSRSQALPLSFNQIQLWDFDQVEGRKFADNMAIVLDLNGFLNISPLEQSINKIVQRHESLRTTFASVDGNSLVQAIDPSLKITLPVVNLQDLPEQDQLAEVQRLSLEEAQYPFDLTEGPLLRVILVKLAKEKHTLLLTMHHIISDGWSMKIFFRELSILYQAFSRGEVSPLPELSIQYADFASWQRQYLCSNVLSSQLHYWKQQLAGLPALLELPTDRARPPKRTYRAALYPIKLSQEYTNRLKALCQKKEVTLYMTLLAAFALLLWHDSRQEDIVFRCPIANRNRSEIEGLIGFFTNFLALRVVISGELTVSGFLAHVRQVVQDAYANQDLSYAELVEELQMKSNSGYDPLEQITLNLQVNTAAQVDIPGLEVKASIPDKKSNIGDLELHLLETPAGLSGVLAYNTDLFDERTVASMSDRLRLVLERIVANPQQRLSTVIEMTPVQQ